MGTMSARNQPRQPRGVPVGGRWKATNRPEGKLALNTEPAAPQRPGSFADMDRAQRLRAMHAEVERATRELSSPEQWRSFLDAVNKFHRYSLGNQMLILHQRPDASLVAGFRDWQEKFGRTVRRGEKAIWVLAPVTYTRVTVENGAEQEEEHLLFRPVPVFDVSQTEGQPLPEPPRIAPSDTRSEAPPGMAQQLSVTVG